LKFYYEMNQKRGDLSLAEHQVRVMEQYFAPGFVGHGDPYNQDYGRDELKDFIRSQVSRYPNIWISVEDVITEGDKTLVRLRLSEGGSLVTNYLALYVIEGGQIIERWTYGDRNHSASLAVTTP
jgi:hypothetical protein